MSTNLAAVATPPRAATSIAVDESLAFDERWATWQAKNAAHDRAFRRKLAFAAPILILVAALATYALLGR
jgi:hypothetical protein